MIRRSPRSVSRRLLIAVAVPIVLFFALTVVALDAEFRQLNALALRQQLDEQIVALAAAVDLDADGNLVVEPTDPERRLEQTGSGQYATLRDDHGRLIWKSPSLAGTKLTLNDYQPQNDERVVLERAADGTEVAALSRRLQWQIGTGPTRTSRRLIFTVADSTAAQTQQLWIFRRQMAILFGALALVLLATMAWMMHRALAPVRRLEQEVEALDSGQALLLGEGYPRELAGVTRGLNELLESERHRIKRYRDTLGNLAHGLKTPLAVIRASLGTELASTGTTGPALSASSGSGVSAAAAIQLEVDRMAQIVEHQLKRAAASGGVTLGQAPVPILPRVSELRVALLKVHARKDLRIDLDVPATVGFLGDSGDIMELLGNVLDNACKWCRSHVAVSARLDMSREPTRRLSIVVEDDGPGIEPADRKRVMERGVRASDHAPGHGLGLSIVRETVALYRGKFFIDASVALGGARIELQLPGR